MTLDKNTAAQEVLDELRAELDGIDARLVEVLAARFDVCRRIAEIKQQNQIPMMQPHRIDYVKQRFAELGSARGLDRAFMLELYALVIAEACRQEAAIVGDHG